MIGEQASVRLLLAVSIIFQVAPAAHATDLVRVWMVGGSTSCANWMQDELQGSNWLMGYWSGRNIENLSTVGSSTDGPGILGEIRLICAKEPSLSIANAAAKLYRRFQLEQR